MIKGNVLHNYKVLKLTPIEKFIPIPHLTPGLRKEWSLPLLLLWAFTVCSRIKFTVLQMLSKRSRNVRSN
jgi:hypothetical protein